MRVICPVCDRRGLIDAESLSDLSSSAVCPRCAAPFRAVPPLFESQTVATASTRVPTASSAFITARATAPQVAAPRSFIVDSLSAKTRAEEDDVLALPRVDVRDDERVSGACVMLDLEGGLFARDPRPRAGADNYQRAVRLMNVSPLWMLAACAGFFVLVFVFDLLLTPAPRAGGDASALASMNNQATNRATTRRARAADADQSEEPAADEAVRSADEPRTGYDVGASAHAGAPADQNELKRAPVSDAPADLADTPSPAAVSFANASGELRAGEGVEAQASRLTIQLGSFRVATEAEAQAVALRAAGFEARVVEQRNSRRPWYCVQTGTFAAREEAELHLAGLRAKGFAADYTVREVQ
ncbi:MAG: SPOR domain-containing protein [Pyrinomonadaceae bacterium]